MQAVETIEGADGRCRCFWPGSDAFYCAYHDREWGRPVADERRLFEKMCLEGFQSGLSWLTILRKRENFRAAFDGFDWTKMAGYGDADVERLLGDAGIIRHRGKIVSAINNARRMEGLVGEFGSLAAFFWSFEPRRAERPGRVTRDWLVANPTSETSTRISKELKKRGFTFVGPTTMYAHMQAMGLVNDHVEGCFCRDEVEAERMAFVRPV
jgi:DNA-3-methyladenine glycosylase I